MLNIQVKVRYASRVIEEGRKEGWKGPCRGELGEEHKSDHHDEGELHVD